VNVRPAESEAVRDEVDHYRSATRRAAGGATKVASSVKIAKILGRQDVLEIDDRLRALEGILGRGGLFLERHRKCDPRHTFGRALGHWRVREAHTVEHALSCAKAVLGHVEDLAAQLVALKTALQRFEARLSPADLAGPVPPEIAAAYAALKTAADEILACAAGYAAVSK
jgi:hypothetical protein